MPAQHATLKAKTTRGVSRWDMLWRAGWLCIALVHAIALPSAISALFGADPAVFSDALIRGSGLVFGLLFCGLKLLNVPFLRLKPGWRSTVSASVAIALLHLGALELGPDKASAISPAPVGVILFVGTFVDAKVLREYLGRRLLRRLLCPRSYDEHVHLSPFLHALEAAFDPAQPIFIACPIVPRAPPFLI